MLHKVLLKVINLDKKLEWKYFCSVPQGIYQEFIDTRDTRNLDTIDMNAYLSLWAKRDWGIKIKMILVEDIERLKTLIITSCKRAYPELYTLEEHNLIPNEDFWVKLWVSSHMKTETERARAE